MKELMIDRPCSSHAGNQPFGPLSIECAPPTLIPRSETEFLAEHVAGRVVSAMQSAGGGRRQDGGPLRMLDLCTGTGCIALLVRHRMLESAPSKPSKRLESSSPAATITAVDISESAIDLTKRNLQRYEQDLHAAALHTECVSFDARQTDMMDDEAVGQLIRNAGPFDVVVCNPPYVPEHEWRSLDSGVREWEDRRALVGDLPGGKADGLDFYHRLAQLARRFGLLARPRPNPHNGTHKPFIAVEVGHNQARSVAQIMEKEAGLANVEIWTDQYGVERGVLGENH